MNLCTFKLAGRSFGVDILHVKEVVEHVAVARVPHASPDVAGLVNIRGKLHLVADLGRLFGFQPAKDLGDVSLVLFKSGIADSFGVLVDRLGDVVAIDPASIEDRRAGEAADEPVDERRRAKPGLAIGVARNPGGLLVVLEPRAVLPCLTN